MAIKKLKILTEKEIEKIIIELAQKGLTAEKIGLILRDQYGWQKEKSKIKISKILKKHNLYTQPDIANLQKKVSRLRDYIAKNKQDKRAKRDLVRLESWLKKLQKYHKKRETKKK